MLQLFKVFMSEDVDKHLSPILKSGYIAQGPQVELFEKQLQEYFNYKYILTLNSATSGLTLAIRLLNLNPEEDEVISTALTCTATNWPILANNLKIKWADVDPNTCNINLDSIKQNITSKTKAIMIVHWGGYPVDLDNLKNIIDEAELKYGFRIKVIEDCAHAFGATYTSSQESSDIKKTMIGTHGNICVFSLQAIKHLTTGDGGLIFLPNKELYDRTKLLRWFGIDREKRSGGDFRMEPDISEWGYKYHMNDINATIGISNLPHIDNMLKILRNNNTMYRKRLSKLFPKVILMEEKNNCESACWLFTIRIVNKNEFIQYMKDKNIMVSQVHNRNDNHSCVKQSKTSLPILDWLEKEIVCIPAGWWLTEDDKNKVLSNIESWVEMDKNKSSNIETFEKSCINGFSNIETFEKDKTPNQLTFRELVYDDQEVYLSLLKQLTKYNYKLTIDEFCNRYDLITHNGGYIYIGEINGKIVCTGKILIEKKFGDNVVHIEDVVVDINYRKQNIGKQLMNYLITIIKSMNYESSIYKIVLSCKQELNYFYESCGFINEGNQHVIRI